MRAFAVILLAATALAAALPAERISDNESQDKVSPVARGLDEIQHADIPPRNDLALKEERHHLTRREQTTLNLPGIGESVSVALAVATVTIYRMAKDKLRVEINNITSGAVKATVTWWGLMYPDRVPAEGTGQFTIPIRSNQFGHVFITTENTN